MLSAREGDLTNSTMRAIREPGRRGRWVLVALQVLTVATLGAAPSWASERQGEPEGISLAELLKGGSVESHNGSLVFSEFDIELDGFAPGDLELYRVAPTFDGFKVLTPFWSSGRQPKSLDLEYRVAGSAGQRIVGAELSFWSTARGIHADSSARMEFMERDLSVFMKLRDRGRDKHWTNFDPVGGFSVQEEIRAFGGRRGSARVKKVTHRFKTVPEPSTLLLGALGLLSLARRNR